MLHDDNKLASFKLAKRINMQMGKMIEAFGCISKNMDYNLKNLQHYIKDLQRQKNDASLNVKKPKHKKLTSEVERLIQRVEGIEDEEQADGDKDFHGQEKRATFPSNPRHPNAGQPMADLSNGM